jgi:hypothetical protein
MVWLTVVNDVEIVAKKEDRSKAKTDIVSSFGKIEVGKIEVE